MFSLKNLLPLSVYKGVAAAIYDILHIHHEGLLSFGFMFAIFSATNGIMAMITAFNRCYKTSDNRTYIKRIGVSVSIVFMLLGITFLAIFVAVMTRHYLSLLHLNQLFLYYVITGLKYAFFFVAFFVAISIIYYMGPAISKRWKFFSAGSLTASLLIVLFTFGFAYYVNSFDSYNKLYGSIGALIGIMLWIYAISIVLLIGFEINASLDLAKRESERRNN
jgi:membrane protein